MPELRKSGIDVLGEIPWGSHFCTFYEKKQDLLDTIIPFFKSGLENNEFCMWVITDSELISLEEAKEAIRQAIPGSDHHLIDKNFEIVDGHNWYIEKNVVAPERIMNEWKAKLKNALVQGYDGLRVSGDTYFLVEKHRENFCAYENHLNNSVTNLRMIVLCTYPLAKSDATEVLDVIQTHQFAIARRQGEWELIEIAMLIHAQAEIKRLKKAIPGVKDETFSLPAFFKYGIAVCSVIISLIILLSISSSNIPHVTIFLCAVILTTWFGGTRPGLLSVILSALALDYYFLSPTHSFAMETSEITRLILFLVTALFIVWLNHTQRKVTGSLRRAHNVLEATVEKLQQSNAALQKEVSVRKRAENSLRESEDNIRLIIDTIPVMAWTIRPDGFVDFLNKRWVDYAGEGANEDPLKIIHLKDLQNSMEEWRATMAAGEFYEHEMRLRRADGVYRWFLVRTAPLRNEQGNVVKWYGVSIDIENSKQIEDALRVSEQRYLSLFENMAEGVAYFQILFKDGKLQDAIYLEVNPAWEKLTGLKNVIGQKISEVIPGILEARSEFFDRSVRVAQTCKSERFETYSVYLKKWLSVSAYCPRIEHVIVVFDDITERKLAEENLNQSYKKIRELTEHLQNIREEERTHIAREIHDELGSQLTVLKLDVSWLKKKLGDAGDAVKQKIRNLIDMLDATVKSVRKIASELRPSMLDNLGIVAAMEWHLKEFEKRSGIKITFNEPKDELKIPDLIKNSLFRIFQESLTNVARHSGAKNVKVELQQKNDELILIIEDDGKGFDKQKEEEKNTLGILGMRERAMMMKGSYEINSMPGKGTAVTVVMPCKKNEK